MNTPSPMNPLSPLTQQSRGKSNVRLAVRSIIALHGVFFGGLLLQGCKPRTTDTQLAGGSGPAIPATNDLAPFTPTNASPFMPDATRSDLAAQPLDQAVQPFTPGVVTNWGQGQSAWPPVDPQPPAPPAGTTEYAVKSGDIPARIAKDHSITLSALMLANPGLSGLVTSAIGDRWIKDLYELKRLVPLADDDSFRAEWMKVKRRNKELLASYIMRKNDLSVDPDSLFNCQIKRMHEYKRQLLCVMHAVALYIRIKENPSQMMTPRTVLFAGKAAPAYHMAKLIIKLINAVSETINADPDTAGKLRVLFIANYCVSNAEKIIPAAELSEQISTAGYEASGTGNMKFALNGALTIGTLDGANIEIMEEVGADNIYIFGLKSSEVMNMRLSGYNPWDCYYGNPELKKVIDMINGGRFSPYDPGLFRPITDSLLKNCDHYFIMADFADYMRLQEKVSNDYLDRRLWTRKSVLNTAGMGKFSSDRTIREYTDEIWNAVPVPIKIPRI